MREIAIIVFAGWLLACGWMIAAWLGPQMDAMIAVAAILGGTAWWAWRSPRKGGMNTPL